MSIRNDESAYITSGSDFMNWRLPVKWTFDNGEWLGSYNTMTRLFTLDGKLYLVYTRKGLGNDHIIKTI